MKLEYNGKKIYELSEIQKKVIKNDIPEDEFESDMARRCKYWLEQPVEKYAYANKEQLPKKIKDKGRASIPVKLVDMAAVHADLEPCPCGYDDIQPVPCKCGDLSFELSANHRKVFRKMCEGMQKDRSHQEYVSVEEKMLCDRMAWILQHKYERCLSRLKLEWLPKLEARGISEIPADDDEFASLVFSQPDYKNRTMREEDLKASRLVTPA